MALGPEPLLVGRAPAGARAVAVEGPAAGVSRTHCRLAAEGGDVVLEDLSRHGTFVNGGRVERRVHLAAGDRVRVGTPGVELELVRLEG
ncbi:MAG: FHA domain-containing protein [Proteobacteria bacterium]|nr:FHA domain-containing protein [Pseudomonadota bacterium]